MPFWNQSGVNLSLTSNWLSGAGSTILGSQQPQLLALHDPSMRSQLFAIAEVTSDWIWMTDHKHRFIYLSPKLYDHIRVRPDRLVGRTRREMVDNVPTKEFEKLLELVDAHQPFMDLAYSWIGDDGQEHFVETSGQPISNEDGSFAGYLGSGRCITERLVQQRKLAEAADELKRRAETDALTGLFNRDYFNKALFQFCTRGDAEFVLLLIDLDHFKSINDSFGHQAGDTALTAFAHHLTRVGRSQDTVCRLGGDEFAIIAPSDNIELAGRSLARRLKEYLRTPVDFRKDQISMTASIGVAGFTPNKSEQSPDQLFHKADVALYRAKALGRDQAVLYDREIEQQYRREDCQLEEFDTAVKLGRITAHFQPILKTQTNEISGVEVLARWIRKCGEHVGPDVFIQLAKRNGLIEILGNQLLKQAASAAAQLPPQIYVALNASILQLGTGDFSARFSDMLREYEHRASRFHIEVDESVCVDVGNSVLEELTDLQELGATIVLDNFGSGQSSLFHLEKFAFQKIKLDRGFLSSIGEKRSRAILRSICALASSLDTAIIAEGVEELQQFEMVKFEGIDEAQGSLFHRPMPLAEIARVVDKDV